MGDITQLTNSIRETFQKVAPRDRSEAILQACSDIIADVKEPLEAYEKLLKEHQEMMETGNPSLGEMRKSLSAVRTTYEDVLKKYNEAQEQISAHAAEAVTSRVTNPDDMPNSAQCTLQEIKRPTFFDGM